MNIKKINQELDLLPKKDEIAQIKKEAKIIIDLLNDEIRKQKIDADVFIGGSFAKSTLVKKKEYDIDLFIRFDWEYEDLTKYLLAIVKSLSKKTKLKYTQIHGSRDYFRIKKGEIIFELIPVLRIKKPKEARNVTDLSYFHVKYAKNKIKGSLAQEIALAKTFCKAQGIYGAESYIQGFSGYALECLIIYYKSFEKMLKELSKVEERIIIDPEKKYKNKDEALINLNESKLHSPVILIDPTWEERNVLAALSKETFDKFKKVALAFLKRPGISFFEDKEFDVEKLRKEAKEKKDEFLHIKLKTDKQEGDIAGTKMKKFSNFLVIELEKYFNIEKSEFVYDEKQSANIYLIARSKGEIIKIGPPMKMEKAVKAFKKANKNLYEDKGILHAKIKINYSAKRFLHLWNKKYKKKIKEMDIVDFKVN